MSRVLVVDFEVVPAPDRRSVQVVNILKALALRYDVDALTIKSPDLAYVDRLLKSRMLRVPVTGETLAEQVESFRRAVRRQIEGADYDVIHFRSAWAGLPACTMHAPGDEAAARLVFEPTLSPLTEPPAADTALALRLAEDEEVCLRAAHRIVVPTEVARAHLAAHGFAERLVLVPPGVDVDRFDWESAPVPARPRVVYAGYLSGGRGVRLLLQAMARLRANRNAELVLAGPIDAGFRPALEEAVRGHGLESSVTLMGPVDHDEMPRVLSTASVCVAPSAPDADERPLAPFPMKILEYMACRRAVVAPRRPVVEEVMKDGEDGLLFDPGSAEALAAAMLRLLEDDGLRERLAAHAYDTARSRFPASAVRRRLLEMYAALAPPAEPSARTVVEPGPGLQTAPETTTARRPVREEPGPQAAGDADVTDPVVKT